MNIKTYYRFLGITLCSTLLLSHTITYAPEMKWPTQQYHLFSKETLEKIATPKDYTLETRAIYGWFRGLIPVIVLNHQDKTIAIFQPPFHVVKEQMPRFSSDGQYLLILNAKWTLLYQVMPQKYEWNLFDLTTKKVIKRFPEYNYPTFSEDSKRILSSYQKPFTIPTRKKSPALIQGLKTWLRNK